MTFAIVHSFNICTRLFLLFGSWQLNTGGGLQPCHTKYLKKDYGKRKEN